MRCISVSANSFLTTVQSDDHWNAQPSSRNREANQYKSLTRLKTSKLRQMPTLYSAQLTPTTLQLSYLLFVHVYKRVLETVLETL